jgi:hypothetical protein
MPLADHSFDGGQSSTSAKARSGARTNWQITAIYLSSHQSSRRLLLKMLSTIIVGPLT